MITGIYLGLSPHGLQPPEPTRSAEQHHQLRALWRERGGIGETGQFSMENFTGERLSGASDIPREEQRSSSVFPGGINDQEKLISECIS